MTQLRIMWEKRHAQRQGALGGVTERQEGKA
jgi:hypothetical protein